MKQNKKRISGGIAAILMTAVVALVGCLLTMSGQVKAAEVTTISVNQKITDHVVKSDEAKWYSVTTPGRGYFILNHQMANLTDDARMTITLYNGSKQEMLEWFGAKSIVKSTKISCNAGQTYLIQVKDYVYSEGKSFELLVSYYPDNNWEAESNESENTATPLTNGEKLIGTCADVQGHDDIDYFTFKLTKPSKVTIDVGPNDVTEEGRWNVNLINSAGKSHQIVFASRGRVVEEYDLNKGTYFIKIDDYLGGYTHYDVSVSIKPLSTVNAQIKKVKLKKGSFGSVYLKTIQLKNKPISGIKFEVQVSDKKNMKNLRLNTVAESAKTLKKFEKDYSIGTYSKYFIQIRPCIDDPFGERVYLGKKAKAQVKGYK